MVPGGYLFQPLRGDVGIHKDLFPALGQPEKLDDLQLGGLPGGFLRPGHIVLRGPGDKFVPGTHGLEIAQAGLMDRVGGLHQRVVVVLPAFNAVMPLGQQPHHGGLPGVGRPVEEIAIFQKGLQNIVSDLHSDPFYFRNQR